MATIKSYTDVKQSRRLAEILPLESADMFYADLLVIDDKHKYIVHPLESYGFKTFKDTKQQESKLLSFIPCWSLAALYNILPIINDEFEPQLHRSLDKYRCTYEGEEDSSGLWRVADNPVDACVAMIEKLHELKLL